MKFYKGDWKFFLVTIPLATVVLLLPTGITLLIFLYEDSRKRKSILSKILNWILE